MKRILALFLAVLMVALSIPMMASADMTVEEKTTYTKYTVDGVNELNAESVDGVKGDLYGTGDGIALNTHLNSGVNSEVWIAYDYSGVYFYFEVSDATQATTAWRQTLNATQVTDLGHANHMLADSVAVSINPTNTVYGDSTADKAPSGVGLAWASRPVSTSVTQTSCCYNGLAGCSKGVVNSADGYTAEIKIPYQGAFTYDSLAESGISFNVMVSDSGVSGTTEPTLTTLNQSILNTNYDKVNGVDLPGLYVYNGTGIYGTYNEGYFDHLKINVGEAPEVTLESLEDASVRMISIDQTLTADKVTVYGVYSNGDRELIPAADITVSPTTFDTVGEHTVTITVGELTTTATVKVNQYAYQVGLAQKATDAITVDGTKDAIYSQSNTIAIGSAADQVNGTAYFAYDSEYFYVFVEVNDSTKETGFANKSMVITTNDDHSNNSQACAQWNDAVIIAYNFGDAEITNNALNASMATDANCAGGFLAATRNNYMSYNLGGHPWSGSNRNSMTGKIGWINGGYTAEFKIPFGVKKDGTAWDVDELIESGISINIQITDGYAIDPDDSTKVTGPDFYVKSNENDTTREQLPKYNAKLYTYESTKADKLEFYSVPTYDVTVKVGEDETTVETGDNGAYTLPEAPVVDGALFLGWEYGNNFLPAGTNVTLTADTEITAVLVAVNTVDAAEIRLGAPTGLRFITIVEKDSYDALSENVKAALTFGTVVLPADKLEGALTKDSSYTANEKVYNAVTIVNTNMNTENALEREAGGYVGYAVQGVLNVLESNYARSFAGRGYVDVAYTNDASSTVYTVETATRCTADVADAVIAAAGDNLATKYSAEQIAVLEAYAAANDQAN